ncbi:MAG: hypothetical protein KDE34_02680 [Anaerolineales bacterium]|nr:hypothetical protein [Anaerolineales bacterium]
MADVYIVVYTLLGMLITLPALLVALNLLLPRVTTRTAQRLSQTPVKSFFMGLPLVALLSLWIAMTAQAAFGPLRFTAFAAALFGMGLGTLGAAGLARSLGARLEPMLSPASAMLNLLRGAVVYELACLFPIIGWFLFAPIVGTTVIGAAIFGIIGWVPTTEATPEPVAATAINPTLANQR